jgi:thioredoxin reductase (NADPH)
LLVPATATGLSAGRDSCAVRLDTGAELSAQSVIVATGVAYRELDADGLDRFEGAGVFYTPLVAHDDVHPGDSVVIVGGGNSAGQAAIWLADHGGRVTIVIRGDDLGASMSRYLLDRIASRSDIQVVKRSRVLEVHGADQLERVTIEDLDSGRRRALDSSVLLILIGAEPHSRWLAHGLELDSQGFVVTGPGLSIQARHSAAWSKLAREPYLLETSIPGVFAAGDVRSGSVKRAASAVGEGSMAIRFVSEHLGRRAALSPTSSPAR